MTQFLNDTPFRHVSKNGTVFTADRCDFRNGVQVMIPQNLPDCKLIQDTAEMIGWHAHNIWGRLSNFTGYDYIHYEIVWVPDDSTLY